MAYLLREIMITINKHRQSIIQEKEFILAVNAKEMGGACGAYGGGESCAQGSGEET